MENERKKSFTDEEINLYMKQAIEKCISAIKEKEVPVGCVFVHIPSKKIFASSHNLTNKLKNATKHAEINCIDYVRMLSKNKDEKIKFINDLGLKFDFDKDLNSIFSESALFVSCEPCIMCSHSLSLMKVREVYFGCENDKFGGNGSILSLNLFPENFYQSYGGFFREEIIDLFRKFYEKGNIRAPDNKRQRKIVY